VATAALLGVRDSVLLAQLLDDDHADLGVVGVGRASGLSGRRWGHGSHPHHDQDLIYWKLVTAVPDKSQVYTTLHLTWARTFRCRPASARRRYISGTSTMIWTSSYDNALAETISGLFKTEVIRRKGPWKGVEDVEFATLTWVDWFDNRRLLEPLGDVPPAEFEQAFYSQQESARVAVLNQSGLWRTRGGSS